MAWNIIKTKEVLKAIPFNVEEISLQEKKDGEEKIYHRLCCPDWVNILPITSEGEVILIRQQRAGSLSKVLETPGGVVEPSEKKDPTMTAARELEEETGYVSRKILSLASLNPNPATHNNCVHFFLALACTQATQRKHFPDESEDIELVLTPLKDLEKLVAYGQIDHALSALCILLASKHIPEFRQE